MKETLAPRELGKLIGRTTGTLQKWDRQGILVAKRTPTNRRYYTYADYLRVAGRLPEKRKLVTYCRVSSASQKTDLARQKQAVEEFCIASGRAVDESLEDIGSGLNYQRKRFAALMVEVEEGVIAEIVIAHKDRLVRFGFEWFEAFCARHETKITIINALSLSPEAEMVQDLLSIVHCFSSRLYGLRRYKKNIAEMIAAKEIV
jgi:predicted site-specific integrase-resolvase